MDHNLSLIRALVNTLHIEIKTLDDNIDELGEGPMDLSEKVRQYEANLIRSALVKTGGNQRRAAYLLQLKTSTLNAKIKQLGINILRETSAAEAGLIG